MPQHALRLSIVAATLCLAAAAQTDKRPDPNHPGVEVHRYDVDPFGADSREAHLALLREALPRLLAVPTDAVTLAEGKLAVSAPADRQAMARALLATGPVAELVDVMVLRLPRARLAAHLQAAPGPWTRELQTWLAALTREPQGLSRQVVAPRAGADALRTALCGDAAASTLVEEAIGATSYEASGAFSGREIPYVRDYHVAVENARFVTRPQIDRLRDGVGVEVTVAGLSRDLTRVALRVRDVRVELPIPTFTTGLAGTTAKVTLQLPTLREYAVDAADSLSEEDALVICRSGPDGEVFVVLAKTRRLG